jgi:uncharacterized membrane protein YfcA
MDETVGALLVGVLGGFAGGLLGIGGGTIYIPAMVLLMGVDQHDAQGASLAAIVATGLVGGITHWRQGNVDSRAVRYIAPIAVVAGFGAAFLADALDATALQRIFAVVMLGLALNIIIGTLRDGSGRTQIRGEGA